MQFYETLVDLTATWRLFLVYLYFHNQSMSQPIATYHRILYGRHLYTWYSGTDALTYMGLLG